MAVRRVHNKIAAKFVNLPMKEIDEVNRMVDDPAMLKKHGIGTICNIFNGIDYSHYFILLNLLISCVPCRIF